VVDRNEREQIKKTSVVFLAIVTVTALFAVTLMPASQQAAAVHHKAHNASSQVSATVVVHHKVHTASKGKISVHQVAVIPEAHGIPLGILR
jgi:hypothetical protein